MGFKQATAMISGKPEMVKVFGKWGTFQIYFKFHKNAEGQFDKLDIGQDR
ncbi:hypothetical protein [Chryseobacterium sp. Marseille-Q8038]